MHAKKIYTLVPAWSVVTLDSMETLDLIASYDFIIILSSRAPVLEFVSLRSKYNRTGGCLPHIPTFLTCSHK
jgi:hypothetical protein